MTTENQEFETDTTTTDSADVVTFKTYHWTELKTYIHSATLDMLAIDKPCIKPVKCQLSTTRSAAGEGAEIRYIRFDENYLKYQFAGLLRELLFELDLSTDVLNHDLLMNLFSSVLSDFKNIKNHLIDNSSSPKVIKPKDIIQALKQKYKA